MKDISKMTKPELHIYKNEVYLRKPFLPHADEIDRINAQLREVRRLRIK